MTSTTLHADRVAKGRLAVGYRWEDERWKEEPPLPHGSFGAMGGMLTTIRDLSRYVSMYLDAWPPRDGPETGSVRRASLREMQQPWRPSTTRVVLDKGNLSAHLTASSYGYGLSNTQTCQFRSAIAHGESSCIQSIDGDIQSVEYSDRFYNFPFEVPFRLFLKSQVFGSHD